mgnify:FL=1
MGIYKEVYLLMGKWVKYVLPFCLFTFLPLTTQAQVGEYRTDFAVGVNGGYMLNQVSFTPTVPQKMMGGLTGGVTLRYTCEKYFNSICAVTAEVNYAQMGWKEDILDMNDEPVYYYGDEEKTNPLCYERRINYIQIPVLARLGWGRERRGVQAFIQIGPQVGIYQSESTSTNIEYGQGTQNQRASYIVAQEDMPVEKKFDYGITGGAGIEYSHPKLGHFLLEGRYYFGLGNIYGNTKQDYFAKSNHGTIVIKMSYLFDIVKTKNPKIK